MSDSKINKMTSITFRLTEEEKEALMKYSEEHDRSLSWVVRQAVKNLLENNK